MKPLTIEQLKALEVGDWVWVEHGIHKLYCKIYNNTRDLLGIGGNTYLDYSDYGTKWLAYKNKEQAEAKGEIVELPCKVGDTIYRLHKYTKEIIEWEVTVIEIGPYETLFICGHSGTKDYMVFGETEIGGLFFVNKSEAERRLAELTKE